MQLTNRDVFEARTALQELVDQSLPVLVSYKLALMVSKLNEQLDVIEGVRQGLIRKYGAPDENGMTVSRDNIARFTEEFNELMEQEIDLEVVKVKLPEKVPAVCESCGRNQTKYLEMPPKVLLALRKFVEVG